MTAVEERRLKGLLKAAVTELLAKRQDMLRDAMRESLEEWLSFEPSKLAKNLLSSVARKSSGGSLARRKHLPCKILFVNMKRDYG